MRTLFIQLVAGLVASAALAADAQAQVPARVTRVQPLYNVDSNYSYGLRPRYYLPNPNYYWHRATTPAEGYARGIAAMTYAQGQYNRLTAAARVTHAEAVRREIENREMAAETYFAMRQANREARAAERGPSPTSADLARWAEQAKPDRLSPSQLTPNTGEVSWPALLQADEFAAFRAELEETFAERAANGRIAAEERDQAQQTTKAMLEGLKKLVREVHPNDYIEARRFLKSLAYEAQLPTI
jgi:hypothetical protein